MNISGSTTFSPDSSKARMTVGNCARCGEDHVDLLFHRFSSPSRLETGALMTHWAVCPVASEPIFLLVKEVSAK